jgi:hypothetical protein
VREHIVLMVDADSGAEFEALRVELARAKEAAVRRARIEGQIPEHLLYEKGWPKVMPTAEEAELLCRVRREVAALLGIKVSCTEPAELIARYAELMEQKMVKEAASAKKEARKQAAQKEDHHDRHRPRKHRPAITRQGQTGRQRAEQAGTLSRGRR